MSQTQFIYLKREGEIHRDYYKKGISALTALPYGMLLLIMPFLRPTDFKCFLFFSRARERDLGGN